ncbi:fungal trichothecene efflux pump [Niveomyces insectorum RCEF 264]|uniref:Fungal trichothecene efflux pump n=1 Tax=Niveomyces insectorum RCEF 264 TaxID=1081102 RepID=A0A167X9I0_9HYPO|nr:fungal trichothecene efflux pump [Niveomyces insectorum RCEF 264]
MADLERTVSAAEKAELEEIAHASFKPTLRDDDSLSINEEALGTNIPPGYYRSFQFIGLVTGLCFGIIAAQVIFVMSTSVLSYTNQDIGPSANIAWVSIARTLGQSTIFLIQGRLSDLFGRRWFFVGGFVVALIGVIICSVAQNVPTIIVGSAIYGSGECVQISFGVAVGELVANKHRPVVMSLMFASSAPFSAFGPTIARRMIQRGLGWRWSYYLGVIVVGMAAILVFFCYHPPNFHLLHERKSKRQQLKELDYVGIFLWVAGLLLFLLGLSWGGGLYPWKSAAVIASLVIGAVLLLAFFLWETFADLKYPVMPMYYFRNRGWISLVSMATVASMFYYSAILLWPQQVSEMLTSNVEYAGWLSCTVSSGTVLGQAVGGVFLRYGGNSRYWLIFATMCMVSFIASLASLTPETKKVGLAVTIIGTFWVGFIELAALSLAPLFCKPEDIGLASGMLASIRAAGGSISVAVYQTILNNRLATTIPAVVGTAAVNAGYPPANVSSLATAVKAGTWATLPGINSAVQAAVTGALPTAYGQAFKTVYLASLGFGGIALIGSLFTKDASSLLNDKVERKMQGIKLVGKSEKQPPKTVDA